MSFDINFNKPAITNAQASQDGGAGNLGYMKGGGKGGRHRQEANSIFEEAPSSDSFTHEGEDDMQREGFVDKLILILKYIVSKIFNRN